MNKPTEITLRIPDEYHIVQTATFKNECPYDGSPLTITGTHNGCFDGEFNAVHTFTCDNHCIIQYIDMWRNNDGVGHYAKPTEVTS